MQCCAVDMENQSSRTPLLAEASTSSIDDEEETYISSWTTEGGLVKATEKEEAKRLLPIKGDPADGYDEQSPIEQVALTVPTIDDPGIPVMTFRMWVLGILSCVVLSFLNQFFGYRREPLTITAISAQIVVLPLGQLMAATITRKKFFTGSKWEFSLNPGPFSMKEHVLITIFANAGAGSVQAVHIVNVVKIFYKEKLDFFVAFLVVMTTQILGFGWAGVFRKYLVEPAAMWWPANLVQVSLFRALHEEEERPRGGLTRNQFFVITLMCSFAYYVLPGYLFPMMTSLSWICWIFPKSVLAQQLGSGLNGLGMGSIGIDWSTISAYLGSPLASPWFAVANVGVGFVLVMYILMPLAYSLNLYNAKTFPIFSIDLFTSTGQNYNISRIVDSNFHIDLEAYDKYGTLHLSIFFALSYGVSFAALTATVVHVLLFHGKEIWHLSLSAFRFQTQDVHTKLMRKYKQVPESWFTAILVITVVLTMFTCQYYMAQLQLPWWGILLACAVSIFFTLPIGIITATTNQRPGLNVITEFIMGYIYPGRPVANICFKLYGDVSMTQALTFLQDFKLGHYMKIPPRTMFMAQIVGTAIAGIVYLGTGWWMIYGIPNICDTAVLSSNSPWTCPMDHVYYDASVIWGLIGPRRIFGNLGTYKAINWFFLAGAIAPVLAWLLHKAYPEKEWIRSINMPIFIGAAQMMPPATAVNYTSWIVVGFIFSFVIYRYKKDWWQRHNYVLSGGLDAGMAFMAVLLYMCLGLENVTFKWWGENLDGCPLASCPTAKGVVVEGCPVFY